MSMLLLLPASFSAALAAEDAATAGDAPGLATAAGPTGTYTLDADFDQGAYVNVGHFVKDQLQLPPPRTEPFPFIWIAVSTKGTAVKVSTETGKVLGEYRTAPAGRAGDPSRTTVDQLGNVWVTNRAEGSPLSGVPMGSITHIGLQENGGCVDRNHNGVIDTSAGYGDIRAWTNAGGADTDGGVDTAADECIIHYVRTTSTANRHVSVNKDNNIWVSGTGVRDFVLINGNTGAIMRTEKSVNCGGYGGLIDKNGVIWSARPLLRWDTAKPLTAGNYTCYAHDSYGLCLDSAGNVWNTQLTGNLIRKFSPAGVQTGAFAHGNNYAQGCVVDRLDHVWVAHSILASQSTVGHLKPNGQHVGNVAVGSGPTGVAVDAAGKVWATNYFSRTASRINPAAGPIGSDGATRVGATDLTTQDLGGNLYNYSDMTGFVNRQIIIRQGTWTATHDSGIPGARWGKVSWSSSTPAGSVISVSVQSSDTGAAFSPPMAVGNAACFGVPDGRFLKVTVSFLRAPTGETPILYDLSVQVRPFDIAEARGVSAGSAVPATAGYNTNGLSFKDAGSGANYLARATVTPTPATAAYVTTLDESAAATLGCDAATATASTRIAYASLAGGLVVAEGLRHDATASYDVAARRATFARDWFIAKLTVNGQVVRLDEGSPLPKSVSVPNVGTLTLFGGAAASDPRGYGIEYRGQLLRLDVNPSGPVKYLDADLVIGAIHLQAGVIPPTVLPPQQDDAQSGRDAPSAFAGAVGIGNGPVDGALPEGDTVDTYAYTASGPTTRLVVALAPAHNVQAKGGVVTATAPPPAESHTLPGIAASPQAPLDQYRLRVLNGAGAVLLSGSATASAPLAVQGAVPAGLLYIEVSRVDTAAEAAAVHYTLAIAPAP